MKQNILPAVRLTLTCIVVFTIAYPSLIWAIAKVAPARGEGQKIVANHKAVGYKLEGQSFSQDKYFWSRPSAVAYNAAGSAGSNKGPYNPDYLKVVQDRIDTFLVHNPSITKEQIPSDLITASGSGLDPDISLQSALIQINRIAKERRIPAEKITSLIEANIEKSINGIQKVNVLRVNIALDGLQ
jgi:K+-transporting ATPase ATPase C chain